VLAVEEDDKKQPDFILLVLGGLKQDEDIFLELAG